MLQAKSYKVHIILSVINLKILLCTHMLFKALSHMFTQAA